MRGIKYDYDFVKPDKSIITFTGHSMADLLNNVKTLTKTHYDIEFKISRDTIYNIMRRPDVAHKFYASKLVVRKIEKQPSASDTQAQTSNTTTTTINNTTQVDNNTPQTV